MSKGIPDYFELHKYNISPDDIVSLLLHCEPSKIRSSVIVTPIWNEELFLNHATKIESISEGSVYDISYKDKNITYIRSGVGAPQTGDVTLALSCTPCQNVIFIGSAGGLHESLIIGDLILVNESISGDGFSNYLKNQSLSPTSFFTSAKPNPELSSLLEEYAQSICRDSDITLNKGTVFSIDTIIAQFFHLGYIHEKYGCIGIEMETSAVFNAASIVGLKAAALLQISDVIPINKSLFSGRTEQDRLRRRHIRQAYLSKIVIDTLTDDRLY